MILWNVPLVVITDTSLLSVSDTEILLWNWRYPNDQDDDGPSYSVEPMACTKDTHCYHTAAVDESRQLLAVSTSDESILLFNISQKCQVHEFIGHTGYEKNNNRFPVQLSTNQFKQY
jgi:WD40 repeat protein